MSMMGNFFRTDAKTIQQIQRGELFLGDLVYGKNGEMARDDILSVDKSWHAIHFTLSGRVWDSTNDPLSKMIISGNFVNDEDMGYGPAMLVTDEEVCDINNDLKMVSEDWFREKFSISDMCDNEVYPTAFWSVEDDDEIFDYIYTFFRDVIDFYKKAESNKQCVLFYVN